MVFSITAVWSCSKEPIKPVGLYRIASPLTLPNSTRTRWLALPPAPQDTPADMQRPGTIDQAPWLPSFAASDRLV